MTQTSAYSDREASLSLKKIIDYGFNPFFVPENNFENEMEEYGYNILRFFKYLFLALTTLLAYLVIINRKSF